MAKKKAELIVALDVDTLEEVRQLIDSLSSAVDIFKIGSQLFTACGPAAVKFVLSRGKKVFLDLKYHDIPNTVAKAVGAAVDLGIELKREEGVLKQGIFMLTLHTAGGREMLEVAAVTARDKAKEAGLNRPLIVGITVLTSESQKDNTRQLVLERARLAKEAGLDGVVASSQEAGFIRRECGEDFVIVTPGIRPTSTQIGDQKRVGTPAEAMAQGSNFLVVGRPIIEAENPLDAARKILEEIRST